MSVAAVPIDFSVSQIEIVESNGAFWASAKVCGGPGEVNVSFMVDGEVLESRVVLVEGDCTLVPFATPPLDPGPHEISISVGEDDNPVNNIVRTQLEVLPPTLTPEAAEEPCPEETEAPAIPALGAPSKATIAAFLAVLALLSAVLLSWFKLRSSKRVKRAPSDGERGSRSLCAGGLA